jgi:hypothetical protein
MDHQWNIDWTDSEKKSKTAQEKVRQCREDNNKGLKNALDAVYLLAGLFFDHDCDANFHGQQNEVSITLAGKFPCQYKRS